MESITIEHDRAAGLFTWTSEDMTGAQVLGLMTDVLFDMREYYIADPLRPETQWPAARICIESDGDRLSMSSPQVQDPLVLKGMLMGVLLGLIEEMRSPDYDPMRAVLGALTFQEARA